MKMNARDYYRSVLLKHIEYQFDHFPRKERKKKFNSLVQGVIDTEAGLEDIIKLYTSLFMISEGFVFSLANAVHYH